MKVLEYFNFSKKGLKKKSPSSMRNGRFHPPKCRGKLQKWDCCTPILPKGLAFPKLPKEIFKIIMIFPPSLCFLHKWSNIFLLKVLVPCKKCSWFKIVIMIFWKDWWSPTPLKSKIHCFLVGRTGGYSFYFLLNLQLK